MQICPSPLLSLIVGLHYNSLKALLSPSGGGGGGGGVFICRH